LSGVNFFVSVLAAAIVIGRKGAKVRKEQKQSPSVPSLSSLRPIAVPAPRAV